MQAVIKYSLVLSVPVGLAIAAESVLINLATGLPEDSLLGMLVQPVSAPFGSVPVLRCFGLVIFGNVLFSSLVVVYLGLRVGAARKKYKVYYPDMYAKGDDEESRTFNCIQRGHQNALETYTTFVFCSLIGGLRHPLLTFFAGILWIVSRVAFFNDYSKGKAEDRYSSKVSYYHWYALICVYLLSCSSCLGILGIY